MLKSCSYVETCLFLITMLTARKQVTQRIQICTRIYGAVLLFCGINSNKNAAKDFERFSRQRVDYIQCVTEFAFLPCRVV